MKISKIVAMILCLILIMSFTSTIAAATTGTAGFAYEGPLKQFADSMTGPVAYALAMLGAFCFVAVVLFGGDLTGLTRNVILFIIGVGIIAFIAPLLQELFNLTGALIP